MDRIHNVDHLLQTGINMMAGSGYHHTSINEVIRQAGMPKGSFYYLYKDKKAFALDAVGHYVKDLLDNMERWFTDEAYGPLEAIKRFYEESIQSLNKVGYAHGCFLGNMGQEMADVDEDFRVVVERGFDQIHERLTAQLMKAEQAGELAEGANPSVIADLIINTWHGSLIRMKTTRSPQSLDVFTHSFFSMISRNK